MKKAISRLILFIFMIAACAGCSSPFFFHPQKEFVLNPNLSGTWYYDVFFSAQDGVTLHGWLIKSASLKPKGTVLFLHGYSRNISSQVNRVLWLAEQGYDVFAFDYRGYGRSEGVPTVEGVHLDTQAALRAVFRLEGEDGRVFVLGQSLGGAIAVYSVANSPYKNRVKGLIIDCAFSSYRTIASEKITQMLITWPLKYLSGLVDDSYSPVKWISKVSPVPVVIIHGDMDTSVPLRHGFSLYRAASEPKELWIAEGKEHVRSLTDEGLKKRLLNFLENAK